MPAALTLDPGALSAMVPGYPWLNPVFWTLAIELQYYLLIGVAFPAMASPRWRPRLAVYVVLGTLALLIRGEQFIFQYLFLFLLGIATFQRRRGLIGDRVYVLHLVALGGGVWYTTTPWLAVLGTVVALLIAYASFRGGGVLAFLGTVSYSLYLLHSPIGGRVINLATRLPQTLPYQLAALALALASSLAAAWVLYVTVERPAQQLSSRIRYGRSV